MVGVRIFSVFTLILLLFSLPSYALNPSSREGIDAFSDDEVVASEVEEEREKIKREKKRLIEDISPSREERRKNLRPFVYETEGSVPEVLERFSLDVEVIPARHGVKAPVSVASDIKASSTNQASEKRPASRFLPNLIFFSVIIAGFLAVHFFIHPKSK